LSIIILSFVVQNFNSTPYLVKTYRYRSFISLYTSILVLNLSKYHTSLSKFNLFLTNPLTPIKKLYNIYFMYSFWINFKKRFTRKLGTVISNLTKSAFFWSYTKLYVGVKKFKHTLSNSYRSIPSVAYLYENTLIPFNFHSKVYNTWVFFFYYNINNFLSSNTKRV
jgi:hypothetical protein